MKTRALCFDLHVVSVCCVHVSVYIRLGGRAGARVSG